MYGRTKKPNPGQHDFTPANDLPHRPRAHSRPLELDPPSVHRPRPHRDISLQNDIPFLPVTTHTTTTADNKHSRSMSNPFPSLFSSKKKKNTTDDTESDTDEYGDDRVGRSKMPPGSSQHAGQPRRVPPVASDFATGNCMTCAGLVRWPKELLVFRCTKCLTTNDLKTLAPGVPDHSTVRQAHRGPLPQSHSRPRASSANPIPSPISIEHTKQLIKSCLSSAIQQWTMSRSDLASVPAKTSHSEQRDDYFVPRRSTIQIEDSPSSNNTPQGSESNPIIKDFSELYLEPNPLNPSANGHRSYSESYPCPPRSPLYTPRSETLESSLDPRKMFKRVEEYLITCFGSHSCINTSFVPRRSSNSTNAQPDAPRRPPAETKREPVRDDHMLSELDPKLLLLGDFAENGSWWTGNQEDDKLSRGHSRRHEERHSIVTTRSPRIDWGAAIEWYHLVANTAKLWPEAYNDFPGVGSSDTLEDSLAQELEAIILEAQEHLQRVLLKCTEMLLKRPGKPMSEPQDVRFLLLLLANPVLHATWRSFTGFHQSGKSKERTTLGGGAEKSPVGRHSNIIKRILGLLANSSEICHVHLVTWLSRLPEHLLRQNKDLVGNFVTYRLIRQNDSKVEPNIDVTDGLIPQMSNLRSGNTPAALHATLQGFKSPRKQKLPVDPKRAPYTDDWQLKAAARVMALIVAANKYTRVRQEDNFEVRRHATLFSTSDFYNTLVDMLDLQLDYELWESKRGRFTFCQYPFFLSIWAKIQILEFDAKRQMGEKARQAYFDSILSHRNLKQHLTFTIRRDCLVEDSLQKVSEVVGSGSEDIKKALRIQFQDEEGVDGGGLRKEWFLLLVREVFNPDHGLFVYDEDSQFCYFNPNTFETSDQYFLVGVVMGLAIYNSTILDVAFPPFAFRKLLAAAPPLTPNISSHSRAAMNYSLDDLAEYRPSLAKGLRQLLEFEGDVQSTFCLDFVIDVDKYGSRSRVPLCSGGEARMVTNANRKEYVDLYVRYLLETSVARQFEPFKRGFFTVCAGNALTLFGPEEIELLVRGSDEPLDIASLKAVATYENWTRGSDPENEPTIIWFWNAFENANPKDQRRLLSFITGSDRIPAMGATSLVIRINCLGDDEGRFPSARTCFNILSLYRYSAPRRLERFLWQAVNESEGFGLK
ncbi:HECT-domain-containing protein [Xylariaceae sp. FL0255]|nr:HECT-domain-containing protein [Xylariaceae sp. FL0255]